MGNNGVFSVKSYYERIGRRWIFCTSQFGSRRYEERCVFFTWLVYKGVILMAENLRERKVTYISWCFMSKGLGEDVDHP